MKHCHYYLQEDLAMDRSKFRVPLACNNYLINHVNLVGQLLESVMYETSMYDSINTDTSSVNVYTGKMWFLFAVSFLRSVIK